MSSCRLQRIVRPDLTLQNVMKCSISLMLDESEVDLADSVLRRTNKDWTRMIGHTIFTVALALSFMCLAYEGVAQTHGWSVGETLARDASLPKIMAFTTQIAAFGHAFIAFYWWSPLLVLICGYCIAAVTTILLRERAQIVAVVGIWPAAAATLLYHSEQYPFGIISETLIS